MIPKCDTFDPCLIPRLPEVCFLCRSAWQTVLSTTITRRLRPLLKSMNMGINISTTAPTVWPRTIPSTGTMHLCPLLIITVLSRSPQTWCRYAPGKFTWQSLRLPPPDLNLSTHCSCLAATVAPTQYYPGNPGKFLTGQTRINLNHIIYSNVFPFVSGTAGSCYNCLAQNIPGNTDGSYCLT
jgi:hypothetical protein